MACVERDPALRPASYQRPVRFIYDRSLQDGSGGFRYVFDEGALRCSLAAPAGDPMCLVSRTEMRALARQRPSFLYVDDGCWLDNADGAGTRRRDFALVSGPHAYLCECVPGASSSTSCVPSVQRLLQELEQSGCGVRVLAYGRARAPLAQQTPSDPSLYLLLGDLHLPPVSWFYSPDDLEKLTTASQHMPPRWLLDTPAMRQQRSSRMLDYGRCAQRDRERGIQRVARGPIFGDPDIHRTAGDDLVAFLDALVATSGETRRLLHFIQTGDMLELWLGRDYQYRPGHRDPQWRDAGSPARVTDWALEVLIQNIPVFEAFRRLQRASLAEVKYLWGNHDAYLKSSEVTEALDLPRRDPTYRGNNGDLFSEHGHRFDRSNHDNTNAWSGPAGANAAFYVPVVRQAEPVARLLTSIGHPSDMRDCYLLGGTLLYLHERYDRHRNPFAVYVMGHTHERQLFRFDIRARGQRGEGSV